MDDKEKAAILAQVDLAACVVKDGVTYRLSPDDLVGCAQRGDMSSSWAITSVVSLAKSRLQGKLSRAEALQLVADTLRTTVASVESTLDWNANYLAWHDGGSPEEIHAWPPEPQGAAPHEGEAAPGGAGLGGTTISQFRDVINSNMMDTEAEVIAWLQSLPYNSRREEFDANRRELEKINDEYLESLIGWIKEGEEILEENKSLGISDPELTQTVDALRAEYDEYYPLLQAWKASWQE